MKRIFKDLVDITDEISKKASPIIENTVNQISDITNNYVKKAQDNIDKRKELHDAEFDDILTIELDQYEKNIFLNVYNDEEIKYDIFQVTPLFSKNYFQLQEKDGFVIATCTINRNPKRHIKCESNPIDFDIKMGNQPFTSMRTCKRETLTRTYLFQDWIITRQVMSSDFLIEDRSGNEIAELLYLGYNGSYRIKIKDIKNEIMVMMIVMCLEYEYCV